MDFEIQCISGRCLINHPPVIEELVIDYMTRTTDGRLCDEQSLTRSLLPFFLHRPPQKPSEKIEVNFSESDGFHGSYEGRMVIKLCESSRSAFRTIGWVDRHRVADVSCRREQKK